MPIKTYSYQYPRFKAEDRCRFCNHIALDHMWTSGLGKTPMEARWEKCYKPSIRCFCPGFAPVDNLDFLAYKHEQKEGV